MVTSQPSLAQTRALATAISELLLSILTVAFPRSATILYAMPQPPTHRITAGMFRYCFVRNWPTICPIGGMVNGAKAAWRALLALFGGFSHNQRRFGHAIEPG